MTTGYTRQSTASMVSGQPMVASIWNAEFNALASAFSSASGHSHSGSVGEGAPIVYSNLSGKPTLLTISATVPVALGSASAGTATDASAQDHVHPMPTYTDVGAASTSHSHTDATTGASGYMSAADKTKLNGIAAAAQVGTVTSVAAGTGLSFSTITGSGTIAIDTSVVARLTAANAWGGFTQSNALFKQVGYTASQLGASTGSINLDVSTANVFAFSVTGNLAVAFTNLFAAAGTVIRVAITNGGSHTLTFTGAKYTGGVAPTWTTSGVDIAEFVTFDGTTVHCVKTSLDSK